MQQRLPDVSQVLFDQQDVVPLASVLCAEPRDQLEPSGTAADNYDLRFFDLDLQPSLSSSRLAGIRRCTISKAASSRRRRPGAMLARNERGAPSTELPQALPRSIINRSAPALGRHTQRNLPG
jgi:hypothetical protein